MNVTRSKTGKHGSAKAFVEAIDPVTGKRVSHVLSAHQLSAVRQLHFLIPLTACIYLYSCMF
jgi:translation elongation factor P/translation initiation factor 5A